MTSHVRGIGIAAACWFVFAAVGCQQPQRDTASPADEPVPSIVTVEESFPLAEPGHDWSLRTPELWRVAVQGERRMLQMLPPPERPIMPGVRRPQEYALYNKFEWRSFWLSFYVRVDRDPAVLARDACAIFGRRDNTHFYYAHLSGLSDGVHTSIMRVDGETRKSLVPEGHRPEPPIPDLKWHKVDVVRDWDNGTIKVFVDAYDESVPPLFEVTDRTYEWGFIGLASFDDHASFGNVLIQGEAREPTASPVIDPAAP